MQLFLGLSKSKVNLFISRPIWKSLGKAYLQHFILRLTGWWLLKLYNLQKLKYLLTVSKCTVEMMSLRWYEIVIRIRNVSISPAITKIEIFTFPAAFNPTFPIQQRNISDVLSRFHPKNMCTFLPNSTAKGNAFVKRIHIFL